jgi:hypothetical protein
VNTVHAVYIEIGAYRKSLFCAVHHQGNLTDTSLDILFGVTDVDPRSDSYLVNLIGPHIQAGFKTARFLP